MDAKGMNMQAYSAHRTREVAEALAARTNEQRANLAVALVNHLSLLSALESVVKGIEIDDRLATRVDLLFQLISVSLMQVARSSGLEPEELQSVSEALHRDRQDVLEQMMRNPPG